MDIAFYRDDYAARGLQARSQAHQDPVRRQRRELLLVDDVLYSGRTVRAAMNELFDYGRPASIALVVLADRGGRQLPICAQHCGAQRRGAARACACALKRARRRQAVARRWRPSVQRNPQLNAEGRAAAPAVHRGAAARDPGADPRHRRVLRRRHRARGEEGAAAARQERVQPVLRELDAHAHHLRDRRQAAVGRRDQPEHRACRRPAKGESLLDTVANLSAMQADMFVVRHDAVGRAVPDRAPRQAARARDQRRRRPPRASDAGAARPVHHPPLQEGLLAADGGDRRRHAALARGAARRRAFSRLRDNMGIRAVR